MLSVFLISCILSAVLTRYVRDWAISRSLVSQPSSARHIHTRPVPRLGGVAIYLTLCFAVLLGMVGHRYFGWHAIKPHVIFALMAPATLIFLLGLVDDLIGLKAYFKFAVQAVAAVLLYLNGFGISRLSFRAGGEDFGWMLGLPLTILWVLWITNAFNLIDGLDGLAAGSALFSTLVICIMALLNHSDVIMLVTLALSGALVGFLRYNFNPATIFLGDSGSLLVGFLLSALALLGSQKSPTLVAVAIPVVSLGLPILDVFIAVVRRFISGKKLFSADREHIHHRLIKRGIPHRQAVLVLYGVSACFALLSLFLLNPGSQPIALVLVVVGIGILVGIQQLRYHEFFELGSAANRTLNQRQVIANNVRVRRTADSLDACHSPAELGRTLQECFAAIGFDGFRLQMEADVHLSSNGHHGALKPIHLNELEMFWNSLQKAGDAEWSMAFAVLHKDRTKQGVLTLFRRTADRPIWMDVNTFTASGFSHSLADRLRKFTHGNVITMGAIPENEAEDGSIRSIAAGQ